MRRWTWLGFALLLLGGCSAPDSRGDGRSSDELRDAIPLAVPDNGHRLPPISGAAPYGPDLAVVVHDTKRGDTGPRVSVVRQLPGGTPVLRPLAIEWREVGGPPDDLEAIQVFPEREREYLTVESGHEPGHAGRVLHLALRGESWETIEGVALGSIELPTRIHNVEGMTVRVATGDRLELLLCERNERKASMRAGEARTTLLRWLELDLAGGEIVPRRVTRMRAEAWPRGDKLRTCSDLYLDPRGDGPTLWVASTASPASGRYESMIYRIRFEDAMATDGVTPSMQAVWRVPGFKVEGLTVAALPGTGLWVATDEDEDGGVFGRLVRVAARRP